MPQETQDAKITNDNFTENLGVISIFDFRTRVKITPNSGVESHTFYRDYEKLQKISTIILYQLL